MSSECFMQKCKLRELVDLALCVPEPGAVNFNILHRVLCLILKEIGIENRETLLPITRAEILRAKSICASPGFIEKVIFGKKDKEKLEDQSLFESNAPIAIRRAEPSLSDTKRTQIPRGVRSAEALLTKREISKERKEVIDVPKKGDKERKEVIDVLKKDDKERKEVIDVLKKDDEERKEVIDVPKKGDKERKEVIDVPKKGDKESEGAIIEEKDTVDVTEVDVTTVDVTEVKEKDTVDVTEVEEKDTVDVTITSDDKEAPSTSKNEEIAVPVVSDVSGEVAPKKQIDTNLFDSQNTITKKHFSPVPSNIEKTQYHVSEITELILPEREDVINIISVPVEAKQITPVEIHKWPSSEEIIEEFNQVPMKSKPEVVQKIWKSTQLDKRISALEESIDQLTLLIDTTLNEFNNLKVMVEEVKEKFEDHVEEYEKEKASKIVTESIDKETAAPIFEKELNIKQKKIEGKEIKGIQPENEEVLDGNAVQVVESTSEKEAEVSLAQKKISEEVETVLNRVHKFITTKKAEAEVSSAQKKISEEVETVLNQVDKFITKEKAEALIQERISSLEKLNKEVETKVKNFQTNMDKLSKQLSEHPASTSVADYRVSLIQQSLTEIEKCLLEIKLGKAEKKEVYQLMNSQKMDSANINAKVNREEFSSSVLELTEKLREMSDSLVATNTMHSDFVADVMNDMREREKLAHLVITISDQMRIMRKQLAKASKLKDFVKVPSDAVESAAVTCLLCGRPAILPERDYLECGGKHYFGDSKCNSSINSLSNMKVLDKKCGKKLPLPSFNKHDILGLNGRVHRGCYELREEDASGEEADEDENAVSDKNRNYYLQCD